MFKGKKRKYVLIVAAVFTAMFLAWWFCLPRNLFSPAYSTVLLDENGGLLGARIAPDGQWRFPPPDSVPAKFEQCLLMYEDKDFHAHWGIKVSSVFRALGQNLREGRIVSGASTLTMQLMRMAGENPDRNLWNKTLEGIQATRAEWRYDKDEILLLYASHAPFGGNVVGLEAASWRYFLKPAHTLTWAESAALAVLPNAPGLIYPGRNAETLRQKRDHLLKQLMEAGVIDEGTYRLSLLETLPGTPFKLPQKAYHLTSVVESGHTYRTSIDGRLQSRINHAVENRLKILKRNRIDHVAVMVVDNPTGEVKAYIGNGAVTGKDDGSANDMIAAPRSSGSILKPFLFAAMMQEGMITPRTLIPDIPTQYAGFAPKNFDHTYVGAVPADEALARSLNVPAVRMLKEYGTAPFANDLKDLGFTTLWRNPEAYGLSLILGGAEVTLFDLVQAYRRIAVAALPEKEDGYPGGLNLSKAQDEAQEPLEGLLDPAVAWATLEAMAKVTRPDELAGWQAFGSSRKIAWKTGTSHGFRDAWAVGITPGHTVAVWVGNAAGEGRPGMTGLQAAAPLLFDVLEMLPRSGWFDFPEGALAEERICVHSGMRASERCGSTSLDFIPKRTAGTPLCTYCHFMHFDETGVFRVNDACYSTHKMTTKSVFRLPPLQAWFYRERVPGYQSAFPWMEGCRDSEGGQSMRLIYPLDPSRVLIPREVDGKREKVIIRATHLDPRAEIHWHIDDRYLGKTTNGMHYMEADMTPGTHVITLVDGRGERYSRTMKVEGVSPSLSPP